MKKRFFMYSLVLIILLTSCSLVNSPTATVKNFEKAIENNSRDAMINVVTPETMQSIDIMGLSPLFGKISWGHQHDFRGLMGFSVDFSSPTGERIKVKTLTENIKGDTAVVTITYTDGTKESIDLKKLDGKWKIHKTGGLFN